MSSDIAGPPPLQSLEHTGLPGYGVWYRHTAGIDQCLCTAAGYKGQLQHMRLMQGTFLCLALNLPAADSYNVNLSVSGKS